MYMYVHRCDNHLDERVEHFQHCRMFLRIPVCVFNIGKMIDSDMTVIRDVSWDAVRPASHKKLAPLSPFGGEPNMGGSLDF